MRLPLLLIAVLAAAGCRSKPEAELPRVHTATVQAPARDAGPWQPHAAYEEIGGPWRVAHGQFDDPATRLPVASRAQAVDPFAAPASRPPARPTARPIHRVVTPPARKLAVPRRRARTEARPVGKKATKSTDQLAREHFLDYPTRVQARKITLHLPPAFASQVRLTGDSLSPARGGRRQARGNARLVIRELTLEGDRVAVRIRDDGREDLQIMARGDVSFVADVRANVLREEGLRSLLITNDQVVPIR